MYSFGEELVHSLTHGLGALLAIVGLCVLVARSVLHGGTRELVASSIFGGSLILMYAASTLFHSIPMPRPKHIFRVLDHCLIYVLIAGTYTPYTLIALRDSPWGWPLFLFVWGLAFVGIVFKIFTTGRFEWLSLAVYLLMGWCGVVAGKSMIAAIPDGGLWLLLAGGLSYSFGTIFYASTRLRYHHAIWHLFVLAGSIFHFFSVLFYVLPGPANPVKP
ncbi:MAG: hemolysin III family protein [Nevskia sp.]|nr:hemolysin III family protein [Nevskia sp.]